MIIRLAYIILAFFAFKVFAQDSNQDTFFLDMGVVIQSGVNPGGLEESADAMHTMKSYDMNDKNKFNSTYTDKASDMLSSTNKITSQISIVEKDFESKIEQLEIENLNLRNQIISLEQRLNSEILNSNLIEIESVKPETELSLPSEVLSIDYDIAEEVDPQSENIINKIVLKEFDESVYTKGVIHYNNEQFYDCINSLAVLPFEKGNTRNASKGLFLLADSYEKIGRYKQALLSLEKLASLNDPTYSELILFKKGIIYRDIGMMDRAQKVFQTLVNFYPDSEYKIIAEQEIRNI